MNICEAKKLNFIFLQKNAFNNFVAQDNQVLHGTYHPRIICHVLYKTINVTVSEPFTGIQRTVRGLGDIQCNHFNCIHQR